MALSRRGLTPAGIGDSVLEPDWLLCRSKSSMLRGRWVEPADAVVVVTAHINNNNNNDNNRSDGWVPRLNDVLNDGDIILASGRGSSEWVCLKNDFYYLSMMIFSIKIIACKKNRT